MTNNRWDARFHPELSPVLEEIWNQRPDNGELLLTVATGIANAGSERGATLLLRAVANSGPTVTEVEKGKNLPAVAALQALQELLRDHRVIVNADIKK